MAFLDNSGDIILDAILTDEGRRRMARTGIPFKITKFALGDDEINYGQWDGNNTGGAAYYDLEILQTPVFEAVSDAIQFGLLATQASDMLYMPLARQNEKGLLDSIISYNNMFHVIDTSKDTTPANSIGKLLKDNSIQHMRGTATPNAKYVAFETGLANDFGAVPLGTAANRADYLISKRLINKSFICYYDSRFFASISGPRAGGRFGNAGQGHALDASIVLGSTTALARAATSGMENYSAVRMHAIPNKVYYYGSGVETESDISVLGGPRDAFGCVSPVVTPAMAAQYARFGGTVTIGSTACVFIDTSLIIVGAQTGTQITLPVRIIRLA